MGDKDTKLPSSKSTFGSRRGKKEKGGGRVRVRVVAMETGGSVRSIRRRHHSAPFAPVRSCLSRRRLPLRSHTEHENFIQKFPLYPHNGPDYFLEEEEEDDESILAEQNSAKLWGNEKTYKKITFCFKKSAISLPPMNELGSC